MRFFQFAAMVALVTALSVTLPAQQPLACDPQAIAAMQQSLAAMGGIPPSALVGGQVSFVAKRDIFTVDDFLNNSSLSGGVQ